MFKRLLATASLLMSTSLFASEPSLFVLRTAPDWQQGIVRIDPETGSEMRFADFIYSAYFNGVYGGLQLTALEDRIIAQGAVYCDFDAASGQLLRRYAALAPGYDSWAFHGVAVDRPTAQKLGIAAGYYGTPSCPPGGDPTGESCVPPSMPFPGYPIRTNLTHQNVLLRRGVDAGDSGLEVATISPVLPELSSSARRFTAIDVERQQFWFWLQGSVDDGSGYLQRLSIAPIVNASIGDEVTIREDHTRFNDPPEKWRTARGFAYDATRDAFFIPFVYVTGNLERRLAKQSIDGSEEILKRVSNGSLDGVTLPSSSDPATYTQLLPAAADTPGANGTYWRSDVWLFNPSESPIDVIVRRVSRSDAAMRFTIPARGSRKIANVLRELDGAGTDAVIIESPFRRGAQLSVYSRTYTSASDGGTYGQAIPAVPSLAGYSNHIAPTTIAASLADTYPAFILDKRDPQQYRHNIGIVNTSDDPLTIRLRYAVVSLNPVNDPNVEKFLTIPAHSLRQYAIEALFPPEVVENLPPYIFVMGDHPAALWLSMVDNKSGDASFIPFTYYGIEAAPDSRLAFPAVAHSRGANNTFWRTDGYGVFWVHATGGQPQQPQVNFYSAAASCGSATQTLTASAGLRQHEEWPLFWKTVFPDMATQVCPSSEEPYGALEVRTGSWMTMVSRTYTTREDGGTYGDILPLYPPHGWPVRHFAGIEISDGFRVNVGLYNGSDEQSTIALQLYDAEGSLASEMIATLEARQSLQGSLRQVLATDLKNGIYGLSFTTLKGDGCWPYISTVDNLTGDPTNWW